MDGPTILSSIASIVSILAFIWTLVAGGQSLSDYIRQQSVNSKTKKSFLRGFAVLIFSVIMLLVILTIPAYKQASSHPGTAPVSNPTNTSIVSTTTIGSGVTVSSSPTVISTLSPTTSPTPSQSGTLLYQADWSKDMGGWQSETGWGIENDMLVMQATSTTTASQDLAGTGPLFAAIAPYQPNTANYTVEAQVNIPGNDSTVGIFVRGDDNMVHPNATTSGKGYNCELTDATTSGFHTMLVNIAGEDFKPSNQKVTSLSSQTWETIRVEANGNSIKFFINGQEVDDLFDTSDTNPGRVGILAGHAGIKVRSFKIVAI